MILHCRSSRYIPLPSKSRRKKGPLRIGLSMGTFNPIHLWHLQVAQCSWVQHSLDAVLFIPNGDPPHKTGVVCKERRFKWVRGAVRGNPKFFASRIEVDREGKSYTVDTLRQLHALYGQHGVDVELHLIIGMDNVNSIQSWHQAPEMLKLCKLLIAPRNSMVTTPEAIGAVLPGLEFKRDWNLIQCPDTDMSSTIVRNWYADPKLAHCADYVVPNPVRRDIAKHGNPYRKAA